MSYTTVGSDTGQAVKSGPYKIRRSPFPNYFPGAHSEILARAKGFRAHFGFEDISRLWKWRWSSTDVGTRAGQAHRTLVHDQMTLQRSTISLIGHTNCTLERFCHFNQHVWSPVQRIKRSRFGRFDQETGRSLSSVYTDNLQQITFWSQKMRWNYS
ncbi:hypothetical protein KEM48_005680 [Puccinia striiformis f. sp. tritici PST-130]|nr:hypothetical protein KEM48_005680 [Puccinia striiformis f. sp. tritici PST-130]